jgi:hypothetical protein
MKEIILTFCLGSFLIGLSTGILWKPKDVIQRNIVYISTITYWFTTELVIVGLFIIKWFTSQ